MSSDALIQIIGKGSKWFCVTAERISCKLEITGRQISLVASHYFQNAAEMSDHVQD